MTSSEIVIRNAAHADLPAILEIFNEAIANTTSSYNYKTHTLDMRVKWYEDRIGAGYPVVVAVIDGSVAGFGSYGEWRRAPAYKYSVENSVYVHANYRRRGISKLLLEYLIEHAKVKDFHTILAAINSDNEVSIHLHEKYGFKEVGVFKQVGFKFGKWLDLRFYQLILETPKDPVDG